MKKAYNGGMESLFEKNMQKPLAERMRPKTFADVVGQDHLLTEKAPLMRMIQSKKIASFILWGPPGTGKTTIARLLAHETGCHFEQISAVFSGVSDLRKVLPKLKNGEKWGRLLFYLWMKFIVLIEPSRMAFCHMWKTVPLF